MTGEPTSLPSKKATGQMKQSAGMAMPTKEQVKIEKASLEVTIPVQPLLLGYNELGGPGSDASHGFAPIGEVLANLSASPSLAMPA